MNKSIDIYTDGFCDPNPGYGVWAFVSIQNNKCIYSESSDRQKTTNNQMELTAIIEGIKWADKNDYLHVNIYTDSMYAHDGINDWMYKWRKNNWKKKKGLRLNAELWKQIYSLVFNVSVNCYWVKGHDGNKWNELADSLCSGK